MKVCFVPARIVSLFVISCRFHFCGYVYLTATRIYCTCLQHDVTENASVDETRNKTLVVPKGTALAYTVYELQVSKQTGRFSLVLDRSLRGGFVASLSIDLDDMDGPSGRYSFCRACWENKNPVYSDTLGVVR